MIKEIEALRQKNPKYWEIYGLGNYTVNDKAVFQNFQSQIQSKSQNLPVTLRKR